MRLIKKYLEAGIIDPVLLAYQESDIDWDAVGQIVAKAKKDKSVPYMAKDSLSFIDKWFADKGLSEMLRNVLEATILIESGGSPGATSPSGAYFGLGQWDSRRLKERVAGYNGMLLLLEKMYNEIKSPATWTKGFKETGFTYHKEPYNIFWNPESTERAIPAEFNLRQTPLNKATWGFVGGYIRPGATIYETVLRAIAAKAILQNRGKKKKKQNENNKEVSESSLLTNGGK